MSDKEVRVKVRNLRKRYRVGRSILSLRDLPGRILGRTNENYHWAVDDVNFELRSGESLAIIGPNGAGKTTILKLLSQVTKPTSGDISMNGRFSALIELGAGFHPDLTGSENIYLNGAILGMKRADITARFDDIVEFSGIGQYIDTPVKRYSSGMYARLGFSIAAHVNPQILLVDEVLAVGDFSFKAKCYARMDELREQGTTLIFVSHNMEAVRRVCDKTLVMYRGRPIFQGETAAAIGAYSDAIREAARQSDAPLPPSGGISEKIMTFDAEIERVSLLNEDRQPATVIRSGSTAYVAVDVTIHKELANPVFAIFVHTPDGQRVYATTTKWQNISTPHFYPGETCHVEYEISIPLVNGTYELGTDIATADLSVYCDRIERALSFQVVGQDEARGMADLDARVTLRKEKSSNATPEASHSAQIRSR